MMDRKLIIILAVSLIGAMAVFLFPPLPQDPAYHRFADQRSISGISNLWNVASNIPFLLVGLLGICSLTARPVDTLPEGALPIYGLFFTSLVLVALGSGYYHLDPNNPTLVWDRLPMTIAFMAFFCVIVGEYISYPLARRLLMPLVVFGVISVGYWAYTEEQGAGDLRLYVIIQFLPMLIIPLIIFLYKGQSPYTRYIWLAIGGYLLSKLLEILDQPIYELTGGISGHALKHMAAALGALAIYFLVRSRQLGTAQDLSGK